MGLKIKVSLWKGQCNPSEVETQPQNGVNITLLIFLLFKLIFLCFWLHLFFSLLRMEWATPGDTQGLLLASSWLVPGSVLRDHSYQCREDQMLGEGGMHMG